MPSWSQLLLLLVTCLRILLTSAASSTSNGQTMHDILSETEDASSFPQLSEVARSSVCGETADASSFLQLSTIATSGSKRKQEQNPDMWCQDFAFPAKDPKTTLVLVRTNKPSRGTLQRMTSWAKDLHDHPWVSLPMMASIDDSGWEEPWRQIIHKNLSDIPHTLFHSTNVGHVKETYPVWNEMRYKHTVRWHGVYGLEYDPSGWDTHTEFVLLAVDKARQMGKIHDDGYVWVFEDDVGICGNMSELVASYSNDTSDFIATMGLGVVPGDWHHSAKGSHAFLKLYPPEKRHHIGEQVVRFSVRFLLHLDKLIRNKKVTAHSEMFPATVCMNSDEFTCSVLEKTHIAGGPYFTHDGRVSEATWAQVCPSFDTCHTPVRLAHSLKW